MYYSAVKCREILYTSQYILSDILERNAKDIAPHHTTRREIKLNTHYPYFIQHILLYLYRAKVGNVSDPSLFIYYDFDDVSTAPLIANRGVAGSSADLQNGKIFGGSMYYETISKELRTPVKGHLVRIPPNSCT